MDYSAMGRCLGGIYISLCSALTDEGAQLAHEHLQQLSESPFCRPEDRLVYRGILHCATRPIEELAEEVERSDRVEQRRDRFQIIDGGSAA